MGIRTTLTLWQPPEETIEAIAAVLSSRWTAARSQPGGLFWPHTTSWLRQQAKRLADNGREWYLYAVSEESPARGSLTTEPKAEDSSDRLRDRHRC